MKVAEIGEFGLIDLLHKKLDYARLNTLPELVLGIGDDAAAWQCSGGLQLGTVDAMVENVHFTPATISWTDLGWKSLAINLSDIAAMGGIPKYALIALALPPETPVENVSAIYDGIIELSKQHRVGIIGGNITRAPQISITITVIGQSEGKDILTRAAARPGDTIAVTGYPGSAAAGLEMLAKKLEFRPRSSKFLKNAFVRPVPRLAEGRILLQNGIAAAIDISDGLIGDLRHICEASRVGARIVTDLLPIHETLKSGFKDKALELALSGGEDYELLFTGKAELINTVRKEIRCPVTVIGEITDDKPGKIQLVDAGDKMLDIKRAGWEHF
jgi:thiamine-monophosphate kinase